MELQRAYSTLQVDKAMSEDDEFVTVKGIATTPSPDSYRDIVEPMGAKFKTPMPLLLQHNHHMPVGHVTFAKPTKAGIPFEAKIPKVQEEGTIKDRVDEAIHSLKYDLIKAVSIGFRPLEYSMMDNGGYHFTEWEWLELSLVTIPANSDAVITAVKSMDTSTRAAPGNQRDGIQQNPGVSGQKPTEKSTSPALNNGAVKLIPRNAK